MREKVEVPLIEHQTPHGGKHWSFPRLPAKKKDIKRYTYDCETWGLYASRYSFSVVMDIDTEQHHVFHKAQDMREFFENNSPCMAFAHNGNSFDIFSMYSRDEIYNDSKMLLRNTDILEIKINGVIYRDTKYLFPLRLKQLGESMGEEFAKGITPQKFIDGIPQPITQEDIDYCIQDNLILVRALKGLEESYADWCKMPRGSVSLPLTTASLAYRVFCSTSWPRHWGYQDKKRNKYVKRISCKAWFNNTAQYAYYGGRVQVFGEAGKKIENVITFDANSMYPSVQVGNPYPDIRKCYRLGANFSTLMSQLNRDDCVVWADIDLVAIDEDAQLFLPNKNEEGRLDWTQKEFSGWLCEPEIKFALENGWIIEKVRHINSALAIYPFDDFINHFYNLRKEMKKNKDPRELFCKLIINSCYGKFGARPYEKRIQDLEGIANAQDEEDYLERYLQRWYQPSSCSYPYLLDTKSFSRNPESQNFSWASFITSYARVDLAKAIKAAGKDILYCDTDSIHVKASALDKINANVPMGDELKEWKLETEEVIPLAIYWESKSYHHMNKDGSTINAKQKGVRTKDSNGEWLEEAGDLTKLQHSFSTVKLATALRRNLTPGDLIIVPKKSKKWYNDSD